MLNRLLIGAIVLVMVFHLLTLTIYPAVFVDEGWLANASWTWLTTGVNFDAIHTGTLDQFENPWVWRYFLGQAPFAASFALLGLGLFQARLVTLIFGGVLLFATARVASRLYGRTTGLLAALFLSLSLSFLYSSRWRQDIILAAVIMLAFWATLIALQENKLWAHFAAGFVITMGLDIHQMAAMFFPAWVVLYMIYYGRRILLERGTWLIGLGGALGAGIYAVIHILPAPETYSAMMSFLIRSGSVAELPITNLASLPMSLLLEWRRFFDRQYPLEFVLVAAGSLFLIVRRSKSDRLVIAFIATTIGTLALLSSNKTDMYAITLYPFLMIPVAEGFVAVLRRKSPNRVIKVIAAMVLVTALTTNAFRLISRAYNSWNYDYYAIVDQIRSVVPAGARVMGNPTWWFGFADTDYRSSFNLGYYRYFNDFDTETALKSMRPSYIVVDEIDAMLLVAEGDPPLPPAMDVLKVPRQEFVDVLEKHGRLVLTFEDWRHGLFEIYAMDYGQTSSTTE